MKKFFILVIISTLLLASCTSKEINPTKPASSNPIMVTNDQIKSSCSQNDLVYHDYGTGIKLSKGSSFTISKLNLNLKKETAKIYIVNLENNETSELYKYQAMQDITYAPLADGVYKIIAKISNGEIKDLTPLASIATNYTVENTGGFKLLK